MSGDQLDLDAVEARATASKGVAGFASIHYAVAAEDVPALVAEVRQLRAENEALTENTADALTEAYDRGHDAGVAALRAALVTPPSMIETHGP